MAKKFQQGIFTPNNPTKYVGKRAPRYRSGWELAVMRMADAHPNVIAWAVRHIEYLIEIQLQENKQHMFLIF